jgi:hypothetical protein
LVIRRIPLHGSESFCPTRMRAAAESVWDELRELPLTIAPSTADETMPAQTRGSIAFAWGCLGVLAGITDA